MLNSYVSKTRGRRAAIRELQIKNALHGRVQGQPFLLEQPMNRERDDCLANACLPEDSGGLHCGIPRFRECVTTSVNQTSRANERQAGAADPMPLHRGPHYIVDSGNARWSSGRAPRQRFAVM